MVSCVQIGVRASSIQRAHCEAGLRQQATKTAEKDGRCADLWPVSYGSYVTCVFSVIAGDMFDVIDNGGYAPLYRPQILSSELVPLCSRKFDECEICVRLEPMLCSFAA